MDSDGVVDTGERSSITEYAWDHRNRLVSVTERDTDGGPATQMVEHTYDYLNRWVARAVDSDGDGALGFEDTYFVYDGTLGSVSLDRAALTTDNVGQIVLQFDDDAQGDPQLTHRYLWGPAVDQILADEEVTSLATPGDVLWPLPDHLGTVRDLVQRDPATGETTIANHRTFDSYGNLLSETNPALDHLFAFTGRALDDSTALQNNLNRWYDAQVGRWFSQDPIGFAAGDANLYRYVANEATAIRDPSGLEGFWNGFWTRVGGAVECVGGALAVVIGAAAVTGGAAAELPSFGLSTPVTIGAGVLTVWGLDHAVAGGQTMWYGVPCDTLLHQAVEEVTGSRTAADVVDTGVGVTSGIGVARHLAAQQAVQLGARAGSIADDAVGAATKAEAASEATASSYVIPQDLVDCYRFRGFVVTQLKTTRPGTREWDECLRLLRIVDDRINSYPR